MTDDILIVDDENQSSSVNIVLNDQTTGSSATSSEKSLSTVSSSFGYTSKRIEMLLKTQGHRYTIVDNEKNHTSKCWEVFGLPALIEPNGKREIIEKFVTCRKCFITYAFNSNITRHMNGHVCESSKRIKDLLAKWVCQDIRPFVIVEDEGFRHLAQELISIGTILILINNLSCGMNSLK